MEMDIQITSNAEDHIANILQGDNSKSREALNWEPEFSFEDLVETFCLINRMNNQFHKKVND